MNTSTGIHTRKPPTANLILSPFTVAIDTREQAPFSFQNITSDADELNMPLIVPIEVRTLQTGDYSIVGHEQAGITIERKSIEDAINTVVLERDRFTRELERMESFQYAAVVVEGSLAKCLDFCSRRQFSPKAFSRGVYSFDLRFRCKWWFCLDRRFAEIQTYRLLAKFWDHRRRELKAARQAAAPLFV